MKLSIFKIILVANRNVGKSNIHTKYIKNQFYSGDNPTIGVEFSSKILRINQKEVNLHIWDTCGADQHRCLTKLYFKGAAGVLLVFDITDRTSFDGLDKWIQDIEQNSQQSIIILVGNKIDLQDQRQVSQNEAAKFAFENNMAYIETSAKDDINIQQAFEWLAIEILKQSFSNQSIQEQNIKLTQSSVLKKPKQKQRQCC